MKRPSWIVLLRACAAVGALLAPSATGIVLAQSTPSAVTSRPLRVVELPAGAVRPGALPIIGHGTLLWSTPAGWEYTPPQIDVSGKSPMNLRLRGAGGRPTVLLTVFWDGFGTNKLKPTLDTLEATLRTSASNQFIPDSLEKTVAVRRLETESMQARFATFTDAALATNPVPAEESRHATLGTFRTGQLWGNFMLMTNDSDGPEFRSALDVIKSLRAAP